MSFKISVIMPIYNAEKYLKNTLNSVINQTIGFKNIELILVDDKSTDNSRCIIEEYSSKYSNINPIFLEETSGWPSIPRNVGIGNATSDYIMFIDSDDLYYPDICKELYETLISENADIVCCNRIYTDSNMSVKHKNKFKKYWYDDEIILFENPTVWNYIFKKSIVDENNIRFITEINEDSIFVLEYLLQSHKLVYLENLIGYEHIERNTSISKISVDWAIGIVQSHYKIYNLIKDKNIDLNKRFSGVIITSIQRAMLLGNKKESKLLLIKLGEFEKTINFKNENLPSYIKVINYFIQYNKMNMATTICLIVSIFMKSKLFVNIYRKITY